MVLISRLYLFQDGHSWLEKLHDAWLLLGLAPGWPVAWPLAWPWLALGLALAGPWPGSGWPLAWPLAWPWLALGLALGWSFAWPLPGHAQILARNDPNIELYNFSLY